MRAAGGADLLLLARVLQLLPPEARPKAAEGILAEVDEAADHLRHQGRLHPRFGDGSLMARCHQLAPGPEPVVFDRDFLHCVVVACAALIRHAEAAGEKVCVVDPLLDVVKPGCKQEGVMFETKAKLTALDPVWQRVCEEADEAIRNEPLLGGLIHSGLLHHATLERALAYRFSLKLASGEMSEQILREIADQAYDGDPGLGAAARSDLMAVYERDPACHQFLQPILFFKGYQAVQAYRIGHWLWQAGRTDLAYFVQMRVSEVFGVDIHPAAKIGKGIMIDHAHSIVIGETAVVGDNVSMLHSVTLGGPGKEDGDRHPKIGDGVLIGAGAKVLGNIQVGRCSRIAAGSVVLEDVPPNTTVAGVPARVVGKAGCAQPALSMDQILKAE